MLALLVLLHTAALLVVFGSVSNPADDYKDALFQCQEDIGGFTFRRLGDGQLYALPFQPFKSVFLCNRPLNNIIAQLPNDQVKLMIGGTGEALIDSSGIAWIVLKLKSLILDFAKCLAQRETLNFLNAITIAESIIQLVSTQNLTNIILIGAEWLSHVVLPLMKQYISVHLTFSGFLNDLIHSYDRSNPIVAVLLAPLCQAYPGVCEGCSDITNTVASFARMGNLWPLFEALKGPSAGLLDLSHLRFNEEKTNFRQRDPRYREIYELALSSPESYSKFIWYLEKCDRCCVEQLTGEIALADTNKRLRWLQSLREAGLLGVQLEFPNHTLQTIVNVSESLLGHISKPLWMIHRQQAVMVLLIWACLLGQAVPDLQEQQSNGIVSTEEIFDCLVMWNKREDISALLDWIHEANLGVNSQLLQTIRTEIQSRLESDCSRAPMVGTVKAFKSKEGDAVRSGELLLIFESNTSMGSFHVKSRHNAKIKRILVQPGQLVRTGQALVEYCSD